jgi:hypothetical protein
MQLKNKIRQDVGENTSLAAAETPREHAQPKSKLQRQKFRQDINSSTKQSKISIGIMYNYGGHRSLYLI